MDIRDRFKINKDTPTIFGYPLWMGRISKRVAKKYSNDYPRLLNWYKRHRHLSEVQNLKIGSIINDCSGFNIRIAEIHPEYQATRFEKDYRNPRSVILYGFDFTSTRGGSCSLLHCGIEFGITQAEVERRHLEHIRSWLKDSGNATWYGGLESEGYLRAKDKFEKQLTVLENSKHITDSDGVLLDEYF